MAVGIPMQSADQLEVGLPSPITSDVAVAKRTSRPPARKDQSDQEAQLDQVDQVDQLDQEDHRDPVRRQNLEILAGNGWYTVPSESIRAFQFHPRPGDRHRFIP